MFPKRSHSLSSASSAGTILMEGVLEKKKIIGTGKVHCILRDGKLWYYEDKSRENFVDVSHAQSIREGKARFSFEIITNTKTHVFMADSKASKDKWILCLREAMTEVSRKNSLAAVPFSDSDEESGTTNKPRLSLATPPTPAAVTLKPGVPSTLPPGLVTRTVLPRPMPSQIEIVNTKDQSRHASVPNPSLMEQNPNNVGSSDLRNLDVISKSEPEKLSFPDARESRCKLNTQTPSVHKEEQHRPTFKDEDSGTENKSALLSEDIRGCVATSQLIRSTQSIGGQIITVNPDSLYAKSQEQSIEQGQDLLTKEPEDWQKQSCSAGADQDERKPSNMSPDRKKRSTENDKDAEEEQKKSEEINEDDDVFPLVEGHGDLKSIQSPVAMPVIRRISRLSTSDSIQVDATPVEMMEVELEADFRAEPIPELPHAHLEPNWSSAFADIRAYLSDQTKDDIMMSKSMPIQSGCAIESLKHFLKSLECA